MSDWYYVQEGKQVGPISEKELVEIIERDFDEDTYVWTEGMDQWEPFGKVRELLVHETVESEEFLYCSHCGVKSLERELITYEGQKICQSCKSDLFHSLNNDDTSKTVELPLASIGNRAAALLIDSFFVFLIQYLFIKPFMTSIEEGTASTIVYVFAFVLSLVIIFYEPVMLASYGATIGKLIMKIEVVYENGERISFFHGFARSLGRVVNIFFGIGYMMALFDQERRAFHDHMYNTRVIEKTQKD